MRDDHLGAYAATCAYFLMISFVPLFMVLLFLGRSFGTDTTLFTEGLVDLVPMGLKDYVLTITREVTSRIHVYVPLSVIILIWSAAKFFHAVTNGLNVISRVKETRGWFFLRFRSMAYVIVFMILAVMSLLLSIFGQSMMLSISKAIPAVGEVITFLYSFRSLFGYVGLILVFLFIYKFLPNCRYTVMSQIPGALIVSTVWMFFSYLLTLYYGHNNNFNNIYGSLTGVIMAMIWLYFCCYFLLFGAELNRVIYEDPDDNVIVGIVDVLRDSSARKKLRIMEELDEHSVWKPVAAEEAAVSAQPKDIFIPWEDDETEHKQVVKGQMFDDALKKAAKRDQEAMRNEF